MKEEMTINHYGGKQHGVREACDALFPRAILEIARLRKEGRELHGYEDSNYFLIPVREHVGRAMRHLLLWLAGDAEDGSRTEHLVHAGCRILMAIEIVMVENEEYKKTFDWSNKDESN